MRENQLYEQIARATGESLRTVKRIGFLLADPTEEIADPFDPALGPSVIDWDERLDDLSHLRFARGVADDASS